MILSKTFKLPIYGCEISFHIVKDIRKKAEAIGKKESLDVRYDGQAGALFFKNEVHTYYFILREDLLTHFFAYHELSHVIDEILEDREIGDKEARAYLSGHLAQELHNFLELKKIKLA